MQPAHLSPSSVQLGRALSVLSGGALLITGLARRSAAGLALAGAGGYLLYDGIQQSQPPVAVRIASQQRKEIQVERSITVQKSASEIFDMWRTASNLPRFLTHLDSVEPESDTVATFRARGPAGMKFAWKNRINEERANSTINWESVDGSQIENSGGVEIRELPADRGSEVRVSLRYVPPAGKLGWAVSMMMGQNPEQMLREDLRRFKQLMEAGEFATTDGQPHGRRSGVFEFLQKMNEQEIGAKRAKVIDFESRRTA